MKVLAAIVTHNRRELLSRCIMHVRSQSRPADDVLVVNNGSTDGTEGMLAREGVAYITQENVGSAGGWHRCIQYAVDHGFDAVWLMDDDGFPDADALSLLVSAMRPTDACLSSIVVREDDRARFVFPFPVLSAKGLPVLMQRPRKIPTVSGLRDVATGGRYPFVHLFNGALVSTAAVRSVGNVNREFFVFGEEVDYFFRLRKFGEVASLLAARHYHPDVSRRPYTPAKVYYYVKNTFILNRRYFDLVWLRHAAAVGAVLVRTASRNGISSTLSLLAGRAAPSFYSAIARGLRGRIGKDFNA